MYLCFGIKEIGDWALGAVFRLLVIFSPRGISFQWLPDFWICLSAYPSRGEVQRRLATAGGLSCPSSEAGAHRRYHPLPARRKSAPPSPLKGDGSSLRRSGNKLIHFQPKTKRSRPEGGGFRWICVPGVGLEEDDAADLEQIPIIEALAYVLLVEVVLPSLRFMVSVMPVRSRSISWCCHRA